MHIHTQPFTRYIATYTHVLDYQILGPILPILGHQFHPNREKPIVSDIELLPWPRNIDYHESCSKTLSPDEMDIFPDMLMTINYQEQHKSNMIGTDWNGPTCIEMVRFLLVIHMLYTNLRERPRRIDSKKCLPGCDFFQNLSSLLLILGGDGNTMAWRLRGHQR